MDLAMLTLRADALRAIRRFFDQHGYLEVTTPVRLATPALETHIDALPAGDGYLRTSPELHMKRMLAGGVERIWQVGPCFRQGEYGTRHHSEFWMLEWYQAHAGYETVLRETQALLAAVTQACRGETRLPTAVGRVDVADAWERWTVAQAFERFADWNPLTAWDEDRFTLDLVDRVEPSLPVNRPVVLMDYPVQEAALARIRPGPPPVAERWELYIGGMELANAFSELTDAAEQRRRFIACAAARAARGATVYAMDQAFLSALDAGLPPCAGVALGFDRLLMLLAGVDDIKSVTPVMEFADERIT